MIIRDYYLLLGEFLYALGSSDGTLQPHELTTMESAMDNLLRQVHDFNLHADEKNILLTKISFLRTAGEKIHPSSVIRKFKSFLKKNSRRIGMEHIRTGHFLCEKMVHAYGGVSQEEKRALDEILLYLNRVNE